MRDQKLMDYIKRQLNSGYSIEQIKSALIKRGWREIEVSEAINFVQQKYTTRISKQSLLIYAIFGILLIFVISALLNFFNLNYASAYFMGGLIPSYFVCRKAENKIKYGILEGVVIGILYSILIILLYTVFLSLIISTIKPLSELLLGGLLVNIIIAVVVIFSSFFYICLGGLCAGFIGTFQTTKRLIWPLLVIIIFAIVSINTMYLSPLLTGSVYGGINCDEKETEFLRNMCYGKAAISQKNESLCEKVINDTINKELCYSNVARHKNDASLCEKAGSERDYCYKEFAIFKRNSSVCNKINNEAMKQECLDSF